MGKLVCVPWQIDTPCHTHGCYNRISWGIVPAELAEVSVAVIAGICDECKESLMQSLVAQAAKMENPAVSEVLVVEEPETAGRRRGRRPA